MSRRSTVAFWTVLVSAGLGMALTTFEYWSGYESSGLETLHGACTFIMFVSLAVLIVGLLQEDRRRRT